MGRSGWSGLYYYAAYASLGVSTLFWKNPGRGQAPAGSGPTTDFQPTTLATQGSFVPLLVGRRRLGHVFAWAGLRASGTTMVRVEQKGSKKKSRSSGNIVYTEEGWHLLCVGPATRLYRIYQDGKVIFNTEITPVTTPSGSTLTTSDGTGDTFQIYWGESDQPTNAALGNALRVGITSRWPLVCYVYWTRKTLGAAPRWGQIEYDIECSGRFGAGTGETELPATNLVFHVKADAGVTMGVGNKVSQWDDQSGNGAHVTQALGGNQPTWVDEAAPTGLPMVDFNGSTDFLKRTVAGGYFASSAGEVWAIVRPDTAPGSAQVILGSNDVASNTRGMACSISSIEGPYPECNQRDNDTQNAARATNPLVAGRLYLVRWRSDGSAWAIEMNGEAEAMVAYLPPNNGDWFADTSARDHFTLAAIERLAGVQGFFDGRIGEMAVFSDDQTTADADQTRDYFMSRWFGVGGFKSVLGTILFSEWPQGLGLDEDDFDQDALDAVNSLLSAEGMLQSVVAHGDEAAGVIGSILQDAGVMLYRSPSTGLLAFEAARRGTATAVPDDMVVDVGAAEVVVHHQELATTRVVFTFPDIERAFRETTIAIDSDAAADRLAHHRARRLDLLTVIDPAVAKLVVERRSQEELAVGAAYTIKMNREARAELRPNRLISVTNVAEVLRVLEVAPDNDGNAVDVKATPDFYGSEPSTWVPPSGGSPDAGGTPVAADPQATFIEVPAHLLDFGDPTTIVVPRVRNHDQVAYANIHLSTDGTTYQLVDVEFNLQTGGTLLEGIAADASWKIDTGPTLTIAGPPDDDVVDDLTADEPSWRLGRQVAVIGEEIFFLKKLTAVGGTTYRLDGLLRARYDTERAAHAIGAKVYVFEFDEILSVTDPMIVPGASLYVKPQPVAATALSLASVTAINKTLTGKGVVPMKPCALRVTAPAVGVPAYATGEDVSFAWAWRSTEFPKTGAGMQGAGSAVGQSSPRGEFEIKVFNASAVLVRTELRSVPEWTYDNADLQTDLAGETNFSVEVREVNGGYKSSAVTMAVVKL